VNPAHVLLALIIAAFLAWSWGQAAEAADTDDETGDGHAGEGKVPTIGVWLVFVGALAVEGAIFIGLGLLAE
jgi:hypothetical protein